MAAERVTGIHLSLARKFLKAVAPSRDGLVVAVECIFTWYWLADLCADQGIPFVLGHALYMKAIHGGKVKHDQIHSQQIATLRRGGGCSHRRTSIRPRCVLPATCSGAAPL